MHSYIQDVLTGAFSSSVPDVVGLKKDTCEETNEKQLNNYQSQRVIMLSREYLKAGMIVTDGLLHWMVISEDMAYELRYE